MRAAHFIDHVITNQKFNEFVCWQPTTTRQIHFFYINNINVIHGDHFGITHNDFIQNN